MLERFRAIFTGLGDLGLSIAQRSAVATALTTAGGQATQLYESEAGDVLTLYGLRKRLQPSTDRWDVAPEDEIVKLFEEVSQGFVRPI